MGTAMTTPCRWLIGLALLLSCAVADAQEIRPGTMRKPSEIMAGGSGLRQTRVVVEGVLTNEGANYFTDRRIVLKDAAGGPGPGLSVRPWLPLEAAPGPDSQSDSTPVLSDYIGKKVILKGMLKPGTIKGVGQTPILEVESATIVN